MRSHTRLLVRTWRKLPMEAPRREIVLPRAAYMVAALLLGGYVIYGLRDVLTPIFLAFSIAYMLDPVVDWLEAGHVPRAAGIALVLGGALSLLGLFLVLVLPGIATDVAGVIRELPTQLAVLWTTTAPWLEQRGIAVPHTTTEWIERLNTLASEVASAVLAPAGSLVSTVIGSTLSVLGSVAAALVVVVLAIYLLNDFDRITTGVRELLPRRWREIVTSYAADIDRM